jgi:hypothetical protein
MAKDKPKLISARKNDIKFFDTTTGQVVCTFNQCRHKFTIESTQTVTNNPVIGTDENDKFIRINVESESHFHQCSECGRKISNREDRRKSIKDYIKNKHRQIF